MKGLLSIVEVGVAGEPFCGGGADVWGVTVRGTEELVVKKQNVSSKLSPPVK